MHVFAVKTLTAMVLGCLGSRWYIVGRSKVTTTTASLVPLNGIVFFSGSLANPKSLRTFFFTGTSAKPWTSTTSCHVYFVETRKNAKSRAVWTLAWSGSLNNQNDDNTLT